MIQKLEARKNKIKNIIDTEEMSDLNLLYYFL